MISMYTVLKWINNEGFPLSRKWESRTTTCVELKGHAAKMLQLSEPQNRSASGRVAPDLLERAPQVRRTPVLQTHSNTHSLSSPRRGTRKPHSATVVRLYHGCQDRTGPCGRVRGVHRRHAMCVLRVFLRPRAQRVTRHVSPPAAVPPQPTCRTIPSGMPMHPRVIVAVLGGSWVCAHASGGLVRCAHFARCAFTYPPRHA